MVFLLFNKTKNEAKKEVLNHCKNNIHFLIADLRTFANGKTSLILKSGGGNGHLSVASKTRD